MVFPGIKAAREERDRVVSERPEGQASGREQG